MFWKLITLLWMLLYRWVCMCWLTHAPLVCPLAKVKKGRHGLMACEGVSGSLGNVLFLSFFLSFFFFWISLLFRLYNESHHSPHGFYSRLTILTYIFS